MGAGLQLLALPALWRLWAYYPQRDVRLPQPDTFIYMWGDRMLSFTTAAPAAAHALHRRERDARDRRQCALMRGSIQARAARTEEQRQ